MAEVLIAELAFEIENALLLGLNLLPQFGQLGLFLHVHLSQLELLVLNDFLEVLYRVQL